MTLTVEPHPPSEPPDAGVIDDARARQRRERRIGALVALAILAVAGVAWLGSGGGGGGGQGRAGPAAGGGGATGGQGGRGAAGLVWSAQLAGNDYRLAVERGRIAVIGNRYTAGACDTELLEPSTLRLVATVRGCSAPSSATPPVAPWLRTTGGPAGDVISVATRDPASGRIAVGPVLMTLPNWDWSHSAIARGDGRLWIYALDGPTRAGQRDRSALLELSARTGSVLRSFPVPAGPDPFLVADADGAWITQSAWGGDSCARVCTLWHVAPGATRAVAARRLGVRTQWLMASGHSIYADVLTRLRAGFRQTIWRLNGPRALVAYRTPARLLPSTDFAQLTGYVVVGDTAHGYFTISQLGRADTGAGTGSCDAAAPIRVVRINPATGGQHYVAALPRSRAPDALDCHLTQGQAVFAGGSMFLLAGTSSSTPLPAYRRVVRVTP